MHYTPFLKSLIEDAGKKEIPFIICKEILKYSLTIGMTLVAPDNQTTTFQDLNAFQKVLANVDYIIDDTPLANFNGTGSYANWLSAGGFNANNQSEAFIANKNVYRTDRIINTNGYSG